jgi:acetyltransferase-like isoleucine patch superfamily enzyme
MIDEQVFILNPDKVEIAKTVRVDRWVKIEGGNGVSIGEHCHIASFSHLNVGGGELVFGAHSGCSSHVVICSGMPDPDYLHISAAELPEDVHPLRMKTVIGEYVVIFAGAIIRPGVTIGDGAIIAAGAVVTQDVGAFEIWAGVPAKPIGSRNSFKLLDAQKVLA